MYLDHSGLVCRNEMLTVPDDVLFQEIVLTFTSCVSNWVSCSADVTDVIWTNLPSSPAFIEIRLPVLLFFPSVPVCDPSLIMTLSTLLPQALLLLLLLPCGTLASHSSSPTLLDHNTTLLEQHITTDQEHCQQLCTFGHSEIENQIYTF